MHERYHCRQIADIWSTDNRYHLWTVIELAFLKNLGKGTGTAPTPPPAWDPAWTAEIAAIEARTKHDVAAFVEWLEARYNERYIHYGLTSSDVLDTAFSLQLKATDKIIYKLSVALTGAISAVAATYGRAPILGRTHGQAAEEITLGHKLAAYINAIRLYRPCGPYYGRLRGSTGDYKYFDQSIEAATLNDLELVHCPLVDGQIIHRAYYADKLNSWAVLASVLAKIATDLRLLAQSEIHEVQEGFGRGQMGSSSMPHKRNPISCENLCGIARVIRGYQTTTMQNIELWNERDISHSSAERIIFPDAAVLLGYMLERLTAVWDGLVINTADMARHLAANQDALGSQRAMLNLIDSGLTRTEAHATMKKHHITDQ